MIKTPLIVLVFLLLIGTLINADAYEGEEAMVKPNITQTIFQESVIKEGVKQISYEQFIKIMNSGENYVLLDVLDDESYKKGHIKNAVSFPVDSINTDTAKSKLPRGVMILVYCGSFQCQASTMAAKKLNDLGYDVLDYKGGLKEWQEKGNKLVSGNGPE